MSDPYQQVLDFHHKFGAYTGEQPAFPPAATVELRLSLIEEEFAELRQACRAPDMVGVADALADLLYVTYGMSVAFGVDIRPIFDEVQRTNMAKVGGAKRADGKVLKPAGWQPPRIAPLLTEQGWDGGHNREAQPQSDR